MYETGLERFVERPLELLDAAPLFVLPVLLAPAELELPATPHTRGNILASMARRSSSAGGRSFELVVDRALDGRSSRLGLASRADGRSSREAGRARVSALLECERSLEALTLPPARSLRALSFRMRSSCSSSRVLYHSVYQRHIEHRESSICSPTYSGRPLGRAAAGGSRRGSESFLGGGSARRDAAAGAGAEVEMVAPRGRAAEKRAMELLEGAEESVAPRLPLPMGRLMTCTVRDSREAFSVA